MLSAIFWYSLVTEIALCNMAQISHLFKYLCLTCSSPVLGIPCLFLLRSFFTYIVKADLSLLHRINYSLLCSYTHCMWEQRVPQGLFTLYTLKSTDSYRHVPRSLLIVYVRQEGGLVGETVG